MTKTIQIIHGSHGWSAHQIQVKEGETIWQLFNADAHPTLTVDEIGMDADIDLIQKGYEANQNGTYDHGYQEGQEHLLANIYSVFRVDKLIERFNHLNGNQS